jgi:hypothetical protein
MFELSRTECITAVCVDGGQGIHRIAFRTNHGRELLLGKNQAPAAVRYTEIPEDSLLVAFYGAKAAQLETLGMWICLKAVDGQ